MRHIAIIGAGITGVTTAYALATRGYAVTVIERHRYPAEETSLANGGQLSASNAEVWNHWSNVVKGVGWMLRADAPFLFNPRPGWRKYTWMAEFLRHIGDYRKNTIATTRLAIAARKHLFETAQREHIDFDLEQRGILHVYRDRKSFDHAQKVNALLTEGGLDRRAVTPEEMRVIEPALHGSFYGGFFTPSDSTGDIMKFTRGLARACMRNGVRFLFDADVTAIDTGEADRVRVSWHDTAEGVTDAIAETLSADAVVICAGVASRGFAAMVGDRLPIYPVKGYSITVDLGGPSSRAAAPWVSLLDDAAKIVTSRLGAARFRVAGTAELNDENRDIRADRIAPLVTWTRRHFPGIETERVVPWAGLRPMMPDMMPRVGAGTRPGVYYNTGHGHLGWTLSAATAEMVAEVIVAEMTGKLQHAA